MPGGVRSLDGMWSRDMKPTTIEKLSVLMLCEIYKKLDIQDSFDPKLVAQAVGDDDMWVLGWAYSGTFPEIDTPEEVVFVGDIFDMFSFLDEGYKDLSAEDKARVDASSDHATAWLTFSGYDGNNEWRYLSIANTMVNRLDRYTRFKEVANTNSHCPMVDLYARMDAVFKPIRNTLIMRTMSADEIIRVISEAVHPDNR